MSKKTKIALSVAAILLLVGVMIFTGAMMMFEWDFSKFSTAQYQTSIYEFDDNHSDISINVDTSDITFLPANAQKCKVVCYERKNLAHAVSVKDNTLIIDIVDTRKWYEHISLFFDAPKIDVYLPQDKYDTLLIKSDTGEINLPADFTFQNIDISGSTGNVTNAANALNQLKIKTDTGDISIENVSPKLISLSVSTGAATVKNSVCQSFLSTGDTGDIILQNVKADKTLSIERSTGEVTLEKCDGKELFIQTDTGDVSGSLMSTKIFIAESDTGRVKVPATTRGGICKITSDTGNIKMTICA